MDIDPASITSSSGDRDLATGGGCTHVSTFCVSTKESAPDGLDQGESLWIDITFASSADADAFRPTELAIHDRHGPGPTDVCAGSGRATFRGATGENITKDAPDPDCLPPDVVPEPATTVLLGTGLLALGVLARRRRP